MAMKRRMVLAGCWSPGCSARSSASTSAMLVVAGADHGSRVEPDYYRKAVHWDSDHGAAGGERAARLERSSSTIARTAGCRRAARCR